MSALNNTLLLRAQSFFCDPEQIPPQVGVTWYTEGRKALSQDRKVAAHFSGRG